MEASWKPLVWTKEESLYAQTEEYKGPTVYTVVKMSLALLQIIEWGSVYDL